jgi:transcriptional regulator with XRE-family HTH domain
MNKLNNENVIDPLVTALGNIVQTRRRRLGLSQEELALRAGLHRTYISEIERRSRNLSVKILVQIAIALDMEPSAMMREAEEMCYRAPATNAGGAEVTP